MDEITEDPEQFLFNEIINIYNQIKLSKSKMSLQHLSFSNKNIKITDKIDVIKNEQKMEKDRIKQSLYSPEKYQDHDPLTKQSKIKKLQCICEMCTCGEHSCLKKNQNTIINNSRQELNNQTVQTEDRNIKLTTTLKKYTNLILQKSPYNYETSHKRQFSSSFNPQQSENNNKIRNNISEQNQQKSESKRYDGKIIYKPQFNKFDDRTTYKSHFTIQNSPRIGLNSLSIPKLNYYGSKITQKQNNRYSTQNEEELDYKLGKSVTYQHHYGKQYIPTQFRTQPSQYKLDTETEYNKQYKKIQEKNLFERRNPQKILKITQRKFKPLDFKIRMENNKGIMSVFAQKSKKQ